MLAISSILLTASVVSTHALWFENAKRQVDCQVTVWSEWRTSSAWDATSKTRSRHILRYPQNGGLACPDVTETETIEKEERLELTANKLVSSFLSSNAAGQKRFRRSTGYRRDLLVIVDSSGSISQPDFELAKDNVARLLSNICPIGEPFSRGIHQAALVRYSTLVDEMFDFNAHTNTADVQAAIRNMGYIGQSTCTGDAFEYARSEMFTVAKGMRNESDVRQEVLILTDGQSNCGMDAIRAARLLHDANIGVYGLMIGSFTTGGKAEMEAYVSGVGSHLFAVDNFQDLKLLVDKVEEIVKQTPCLGFDIN